MRNIIKRNVPIILICLILCGLSLLYCFPVSIWTNKYNGITIVLDAGHGGRDGGSIGENGTIEKEINLEYVLALKQKLLETGYSVVLTRKTDDGLYSQLAGNKKISDMNARMEIIKKANPSLVISIHMNSFADSSVKGANCFYKLGDEASMRCANLIQESLNVYCGAKNKNAQKGDYYILNCSYYTSVLVECGFISNPEEERKLKTEDYKKNIVDAIYSGVLLYFGC